MIKYSVTDSKQLVVDNAFVVKATLETEGESVIVAPRSVFLLLGFFRALVCFFGVCEISNINGHFSCEMESYFDTHICKLRVITHRACLFLSFTHKWDDGVVDTLLVGRTGTA